MAVDGASPALRNPHTVGFSRLLSTMLTLLLGHHSLLESIRTIRRMFSEAHARDVSGDVRELRLDVILIPEWLGYPNTS